MTRTRVAQELQGSGLHIFVSLKQLSSTCHVPFLAALDTGHKHKFSLTRLVHFSYLSDSLTNTQKTKGARPKKPCDVPRQSGGSTQIPSLTGCEPKTKVIETEAIVPEDLEPRRIELDRNLGTDPYQTQERFARNLEKLVRSRPTSSHRCIPIVQTRMLKTENYEKCQRHH